MNDKKLLLNEQAILKVNNIKKEGIVHRSKTKINLLYVFTMMRKEKESLETSKYKTTMCEKME